MKQQTKAISLMISMPIIIVFLILYFSMPEVLPGYHVEQETTKTCGKTELVTYVWHNAEIVKSWYDDIDTIDDSTKIKRRIQARELIGRLKK